ncbi:MAG: UDP-N-acetylmuramoyl-tripeptide--D-alanyl-D-alanine ligase [Polyangiaceae bacterium]|nr:UDP-N-acetylmuramoyl-tripeptide--D-alanyl-D-alanine ligase [Polyangiaceae bacterium]
MATPIPPNQSAWTSGELAQATGGRLEGTAERKHVGVTTDSRACDCKDGAGSVFVALRGENTDGHTFITAAIEKGATALVIEEGAQITLPEGVGVDVVNVKDTLVAFRDLACVQLSRWRDKGGRLVVVTGSSGKTTTKDMTRALLAVKGTVLATPGNLNNLIGVPAVLLTLTNSSYAVIEIGMSVPGEIKILAELLSPDVAIITNIGSAHAEGVGGIDGVEKEKGALFQALPETSWMVINADDKRVVRQARTSEAQALRVGRAFEATDYRVHEYESLGLRGSRFLLRTATGLKQIALPLHGEHIATDFALAYAAAETLARIPFEDAEIAQAINSLSITEGRATLRRASSGAIILDDSYNANPGSMEAAIRTASELAHKENRRLVVVLGEMKELGDLTEAAHERIGEVVGEVAAKVMISCGGAMTLAAKKAKTLGVSVLNGQSTMAASQLAVAMTEPGDLILVKGSRSVGTERVVEALVLGGAPEFPLIEAMGKEAP